ncbi:hypothetical protein RWV98_07630 [Agathobaculum sp. NTUH-O15-33]|nr:hypothetical protein [Agathobaculum sp. NTUH-O15-33]WNX86134.1 hypothetical protein RWV98_07630 [Agathobaculum sp. NTUH-O15-33]
MAQNQNQSHCAAPISKPTSGKKLSAQRMVFFSQFTCGTGMAE